MGHVARIAAVRYKSTMILSEHTKQIYVYFFEYVATNGSIILKYVLKTQGQKATRYGLDGPTIESR